jgi:hypothetical protein
MIVGMLTYLSMSSRPDIAFGVYQCARFSTCPMHIHEIAIHCICCYLQATPNKGYILQPTPNHHNLDCYVDADFAGLWTEASSSESTSVKSRTSFVILFANCPVLWVSKLQTEVALSTIEAEYISLSQAMRDLIPMQALLTELTTLTCLTFDMTTTYSTSLRIIRVVWNWPMLPRCALALNILHCNIITSTPMLLVVTSRYNGLIPDINWLISSLNLCLNLCLIL